MKKTKTVMMFPVILTVALCLVYVTGCDDPQAIGRFQATPVTNIILNNLGVVDEEPEPFANARSPRPEDLLVPESEYVIRSGDVINISIMDLFQSNNEWQAQKQVSESGRITLPEIGSVMAAGYTELELQKSLERALSPDYIKEPKVSVVVAASTGKVYTVTGAVPAPAPYQLTEPDLRILKALAHAGGVPPRGVDFVYVIRKVPTSDLLVDEQAETVNAVSDAGVFSPVEIPAEYQQDSPAQEAELAVEAEQATEPELQEAPSESEPQEVKTVEQELLETVSPLSVVSLPTWSQEDNQKAVELTEGVPADGFEVVMGEDGFQVEGQGNEPVSPESLGNIAAQDDVLGYKPLQYGQEVIKINLKELNNGDLSQNIVILPGDYISVPYNATGVYYVMGQVSRPGPYQLTGEKMTLKQAIASVGGLAALASPDRCDITRATGNNSEITYRVNLQKLFEGVQPDIYIKPNDMINVGSHPTARWLAVIRQSFRTTYGFGFVYDRNLADVDFGR
ncbi:MAG: polysaccharide biosynthesis/export family protein [Sedimentisphaerales bacterium]|nr:polysaccharide biosynthesis/export family protein [Sedimentisphaerales bacterium]MBN2842619.1 polysaccharide biosynthesis/export family protein [Sedimentisphaerales bacterium]